MKKGSVLKTQILLTAETQYKKKQYGIALEMYQLLKKEGYKECALMIGNCYHHLGYYALALEQYENQSDYQSFINDNKDLSQYHLKQIDCYDKLGDMKSLEKFRDAYQNVKNKMGIKYKDVIIPYINGILEMKKNKNFEQARVEFEKSQRALPFSREYIKILDQQIRQLKVKESQLKAQLTHSISNYFILIDFYLEQNNLVDAENYLIKGKGEINKLDDKEAQKKNLNFKYDFYKQKIDWLNLKKGKAADIIPDNIYKKLQQFVEAVNIESDDFQEIKNIFIEAHQIIFDTLSRIYSDPVTKKKEDTFNDFQQYLKTKKLKQISGETHHIIKGKIYCLLNLHQKAYKQFRMFSAYSGKLLDDETKEMEKRMLEKGKEFENIEEHPKLKDNEEDDPDYD